MKPIISRFWKGGNNLSSLSLKELANTLEEVNFKHIFGYEWKGRRFTLTAYFDSRTRLNEYIPVVKPIGKKDDVYYICCPNCNRFEAVHESEIADGKMVTSKCKKSSNKVNRIIVKYSKRASKANVEKLQQFGYYIDLKGWCD